jgi:hypothetical protein
MKRRALAILATHALVTFPWSVTISFMAGQVHPAFLLLYVALLPGAMVLALLVAAAVSREATR